MINQQALSIFCVIHGILLALLAILEDDGNREVDDQVAIVEAIVLHNNRGSRRGRGDDEADEIGEIVQRKRRYHAWDWERARGAILSDCWGPGPKFDDRQFERVFRVSKPIAERLLAVL
jgi:hypothetical protein